MKHLALLKICHCFYELILPFFSYKLLRNVHKNTNDMFYDIVIVSQDRFVVVSTFF